MANKKNKTIIIVVILVIITAVLIVLAVNKSRHSGGTKVATEKVERRTIIETVSANGKIQPAKDIKITPYISGEVVALYVKEGEYVKQGQILAKIDPKIYISTYEKAKAALKTAEANEANAGARVAQVEAQFTKAKLDYERSEKLFKNNVISAADFDAAKSGYQVAKAEVKAAKESYKAAQFQVSSAKAQLNEAKENLDRTNIYAPQDGTVSKLSVEAGERVTGASQFSAGTEIMRIANLENMEVKVEVNENDIVRVALNDTADIEVDAYLDRKFKGYVTEIATSANTTGVSADQVTNFDVKIRLLKSSYSDLIKENDPIKSPFRPGMSAAVEIRTERVDNALSVPIQAVTTRADSSGRLKTAREKRDEEKAIEKGIKQEEENKEYVFVFDNDKARLQEVKTGIQDNMYIQILKGLNEGEEVITAPYSAVSKTLRNGSKVTKVNKKELFKNEKK